jgi:hypothetical protein
MWWQKPPKSVYLLEKVRLCSNQPGGLNMDEPVHLTLYVTRNTAIEATKNLMKALGMTKEDVAELKIVDVATHPELAESDNVGQTPCLKVARGDDAYIVGDLSDPEAVELALRGQRSQRLH